MSNIHVTTVDGNEVTAVLHFAIPATNNAAGCPWRTIAALVYGTTTLPDGDGTLCTIAAAEKSSIVAGAVVEQVRTFKLGNANPSGAALDAAHAAAQTAFVAEFQTRYDRFGTTR